MAEKKSAETRIAHGEWAKRLREDPMFTAIKNGIMVETMADMMSTGDKVKVSELHDMLRGLEKFEQALVFLVNDAAKARSEAT